MSRNDFNMNDFMMFNTIKGGGCGGCLISALSIIGSVILLAVLIF